MIASYSISAGMVTESELIHTLYNVILRIARNFLETRENVKILTHFLKKKIQNGRFFKIAVFQNRQFLKKNCENFTDWSLG